MRDKRESKPERSLPSRFAMAMVIAALVCVAAAWLMSSFGKDGSGPKLPYVWTDIAVVYFLGALPLAGLLVMSVTSRLHGQPMARVIELVLAAALFAAAFAVVRSEPLWPRLIGSGWLVADAIVRTCLAIVVAVSAILAATTLFAEKKDAKPRSRQLASLLVALAFATLVPAAYTQARIGYFQGQLSELISQHRLGQAQRLAERLHGLAPHLQMGNQPIGLIAEELNRQVQFIEQQLSQSSELGNSLEARLERARLFAILGNVEEAHRTLKPLLRMDPPHPAACLLIGTAYESREDWRTSRTWYEQARSSLLRIGPPPQALPALVQATKGLAYTERKLGRFSQAEAAYLEALRLSPTADMHFLLAQFYDDGQQAAKAHEHALLAAQQDPTRFAKESAKLIDKLATHQFGCLSVFFRDRQVVSPAVGPTR